MKVFISILIVLVVLIVILLIIAAFYRKKYSVERQIQINKPKNEVFAFIKLLKNQNRFSKWALMDKDMKIDYTGTDGMPGFTYSWESNNPNVGKGEQKITSIKEGEKIEYEIHFIKPFESTALAYMKTDSINSNQTKIVWGFNSRMKYPMNLFLLFMNMENMIGNDFSAGLSNLKKILESK